VGNRIHVFEDSAALTADMLDGFWRELRSWQLNARRCRSITETAVTSLRGGATRQGLL
jgi:hypothetical protein